MTECASCLQKGFRKNRILHAVGIMVLAFLIIFVIGVMGFKYIFGMTMTDSVFNTALSISNLDISHYAITKKEKAFLGLYSLIGSILFISLASTIVAYIFTRYFD